MQYRIALVPQLEVSASEFAAAWNTSHYAADAPARPGNISKSRVNLAEKLGISVAESEALLDRFEETDAE